MATVYNPDLFRNTETVGHLDSTGMMNNGRTGPALANPSLDNGPRYQLRGTAKPVPRAMNAAQNMTMDTNAMELASLDPPRRWTAPQQPAIDRSRNKESDLYAFLATNHRNYQPLHGSTGQIPNASGTVVAANMISDTARRQMHNFDEGFEVNSGANRVAFKNEAYMARVNRVRERSEIDPHTGRRVDYYRSLPPEGNTDRRISKDQLQHINPRLRMIQGYDSSAPRIHKREVRQAMSEPDNVFGDIVYQDRIRSEMEERLMRDIWWNRNGESVPTVRDEGQAFGYRGLNNMLRFEPYMEPTQREGWRGRSAAGHLENVASDLDGAQAGLRQRTDNVRDQRKQGGVHKAGFHGPGTAAESRATIRTQQRTDPKAHRDQYQGQKSNFKGIVSGPDAAARDHVATSDRPGPQSHETAKPKGLLGHIQAFFAADKTVDQTADRQNKINNKGHRSDMQLRASNAVPMSTDQRVNMVYRASKGTERRRTAVDDGATSIFESQDHLPAQRTRSGRMAAGQRVFNRGYDQTLFDADEAKRVESMRTKVDPQRVDQKWDPDMAGAGELDYHTPRKAENHGTVRGRQNATARIAQGLQPVANVDYYTTRKSENQGTVRGRQNATGNVRHQHDFADPEFAHDSHEQVESEHVARSRKAEGGRGRKNLGAMQTDSADHPDAVMGQKDPKRRAHQQSEADRARANGETILPTTRQAKGDQSRAPHKREGQQLKMHYQPGAADGLGGARASELNYESLTRSDAKRGGSDQTYRMNYGHGAVVPGTGGSAVMSRTVVTDHHNRDRTTRNRLFA